MVVDEIRRTGADALAVKVDCNDDAEVALLGIHPWMHREIDALILNHGRYERVAAEDMTIAGLRTTMKTNFEGAVAVWKAVQPHLTDSARIVVVGSQIGHTWLTAWCGLFSIKSSISNVGPFFSTGGWTTRKESQYPCTWIC